MPFYKTFLSQSERSVYAHVFRLWPWLSGCVTEIEKRLCASLQRSNMVVFGLRFSFAFIQLRIHARKVQLPYVYSGPGPP